jgi:hypothetical protein
MASLVSSIDMGKEVKARLIVKVTIARSFKWRMVAAAYVVRLASLICPLNVEVEDTREGPGQSL